MKNSFFILTLAVFGLTFSGCGKDQTPDEYQRQLLQENLSVYESIAGTYTGVVTNAKSGKTMGALQLDLSAETVTVDRTTGETTVGSPTLVTNVTYRDQSNLNFRIDSGYYDPDTGAYSATVVQNASRGADLQQKLIVKGSIHNGRFVGTIGSPNVPSAAALFDLRLNGTPIEKIRAGAPKGDLDQVGVAVDFDGTGVMPDSRTGKSARRKMSIHITKPSMGPAGDFIDIFNPTLIRNLNVSIDISEAVSVNFMSVPWDPANGTIDGYNNVTTTSGAYTIYLQCQDFYFKRQATKFKCTYWSSRSKRIPMEFGPSDD